MIACDDWPRRWSDFNATLDCATTVAVILDDDAICAFAINNDLTASEVWGLLKTHRHLPNYLQFDN
jgi:hypothetical protein